jgi:2-oxo-4-hydroxy-4-carboxy-5-ureidoimidazoline decarboxylase
MDRELLRQVCASRTWVDAMAAAAPYGDLDDALRANDQALAAMDKADLDEAMAGHPRIGERSEHASSQREQSGVGDDVRAALAEGNRAYEERFGHVYLVCASGRSGEELLAVLRTRLGNDAATERRVAREELRRIIALRLERLLQGGAG